VSKIRSIIKNKEIDLIQEIEKNVGIDIRAVIEKINE